MSRSRLFVPAAAALVFALSGCGGDVEQAARDGFEAGKAAGASSAPAAPASPTADPNARVTIPDGLDGANGAIAMDRLRKAGLTNVQAASQDEADKVVINAANWTVTKVEPGEGTEVGASDTVVVTMTKE